MKKSIINTSILLIVTLIIASCASRYKLELHLTTEDFQSNVKVKSTDFVLDAILNNPMNDNKIRSGNGNVAILTVETRGLKYNRKMENVLTFDEYFRSRLYLQLPEPLTTDTIKLRGNSFVHLLGRYDWKPSDKIFMPINGMLVIDSINNKNFFGSINGRFENSSKYPFEFSGKFKVKIID